MQQPHKLVRLSEDLYVIVRAGAQASGCSMSAWILEAINEYVADNA